jgi:ABC-type lipoprotein release transport system permease subunit
VGETEALQDLERAVADSLMLDDYGLRLADNPTSGHLVLSSDAMTLSSAEVQAARQAAEDVGAGAAISSVYLIDEVRNLRTGRSLAYSMAAGLQPAEGFRLLRGTGEPSRDSIWLNEWAAADLAAAPGDELVLRYMLPTEEGSYPTEQLTSRVSGIVAMEAGGADPGLVPEFKGITDAAHVDEWDTPFPVDYSLIRDRDEQYWDRYRAAPKLFMDPARLQAIWRSAPGGEQADWVTSVRIRPPEHAAADFSEAYTRRLLARLAEAQTTITLRPVRELALEASKGTSDFSGLFLGLSMFLVFAGAGLGGMLLRLSVDRRASQAGTMLATGCPPAMVHNTLRAEGLLLGGVGTLVGLPAGVLYARGIIGALERWWAGAIGSTSTLWLHAEWSSILIGALVGLGVGLLVTVLSTRGLVRVPLLSLLAGWRGMSMAPAPSSGRAARPTVIIALAAACVLGILSVGSGQIDPTAAFFGIGACLLVASLSGASLLLSGARRMSGATGSLSRLALRNAAAGGARSLLVMGLLACATFVVVAVAANGRDPARADTSSRESGSGGFELMATSSVPLPYDPRTATGRTNLGFLPEDEALLEGTVVISLLAGPGEDISCLNIARPSHPRIIGVPDELIRRGGFSFAGERAANPWELLTDDGDGSLPAFGDAASVQWTLHLGQGDEYSVQTPGGESVLRFAGLLKGSIFQSELLVSDASFRRLYPDISSPSYLLIDTPEGKQEQVRQVLMARLGELGLRVRTSSEVLDGYLQVQNTYLSMFLALGGLGLLLGTVGLVTVLLRGAFERRGELALMLATGFQVSRVRALLVVENGGLLVAGLVLGAACALVAVAPHLASAEAEVNWQFLAAILSGIILFGLVSCAVAVSGAVGGRLIGSLRAE